MRVIQPHRSVRRSKSKSKKPLFVGIFTLLIVATAGIYGSLSFNKKNEINEQTQSSEVLAEQRNQKQIANPGPEDFKYFAGEEFQKLFDSVAYPNTQTFSQPPSITGDESADDRIRTIATSRGYAIHSVPVAPIDKTNTPGLVGDDLLQPLAYNAWQVLKKSADAEGIPIKLNSGYRSIEMQRKLFLSRLYATGASDAQIANGQADNQVVSVLSQAAIPGYSRHHTGYTVDFVCANGTQTFETTTCFKWLSENNYLNAKKHGWIPSYPDGANNQGPEPEPWEYVWVGVPTLLKD